MREGGIEAGLSVQRIKSAIIGITTASRRSHICKDGRHTRGLSSESVGSGRGDRDMGVQEEVAKPISGERRVAIGGIVGQLVGARRSTNGKKGSGSIRVESGSWNQVDRKSGLWRRGKACVKITACGGSNNGACCLR
jgi:hypothetical protein